MTAAFMLMEERRDAAEAEQRAPLEVLEPRVSAVVAQPFRALLASGQRTRTPLAHGGRRRGGGASLAPLSLLAAGVAREAVAPQ